MKRNSKPETSAPCELDAHVFAERRLCRKQFLQSGDSPNIFASENICNSEFLVPARRFHVSTGVSLCLSPGTFSKPKNANREPFSQHREELFFFRAEQEVGQSRRKPLLRSFPARLRRSTAVARGWTPFYRTFRTTGAAMRRSCVSCAHRSMIRQIWTPSVRRLRRLWRR